MVRAAFLVLCTLSAALAQYTGPMFDPGNAPFFGASSLVIPTLSDTVPSVTETPTFIRSRVTSAASSVSGTASPSLQTTVSRNATVSASSSSSSASRSSSASVSLSSSLTTSASRTASASASTSAPAQSAGAAVANGPGVVGVIAGGLFAGMVML